MGILASAAVRGEQHGRDRSGVRGKSPESPAPRASAWAYEGARASAFLVEDGRAPPRRCGGWWCDAGDGSRGVQLREVRERAVLDAGAATVAADPDVDAGERE